MCIYFFTFKSVYNEQKQLIIYVLQQFKVKSNVLLLKNVHDKLLYILNTQGATCYWLGEPNVVLEWYTSISRDITLI